LLFVRPKIFSPDELEHAASRCFVTFGGDTQHITILQHDVTVPVGGWALTSKKETSQDPFMKAIAAASSGGTGVFRRLRIGVQPMATEYVRPSHFVMTMNREEEDYDKFFALTRLPTHHANLIDKLVLRDIDLLWDCLLSNREGLDYQLRNTLIKSAQEADVKEDAENEEVY